jgi:hypothetical protein
VTVPVGSISKLTEHALHAALSLGDEVIAVSVQATLSCRYAGEGHRRCITSVGVVGWPACG